MARRQQGGGEMVHERPAWILPVLVILTVTAFSGLFLYYYFGPRPAELLGQDPRASAATRRVEAIVGGMRFLIPENFTRYPAQRNGGVHNEMAMHALLPDFAPYTPSQDEEFADQSANSEVIYFTLQKTESTLPATRRLKEIYAKQFASPKPEQDPSGLERFTFKEKSGYADQDLLAATDKDGHLILLMCQRATELNDSPNCTRTVLMTSTLSLTYRYKRAHLEAWQRIDELTMRIVSSFEAPGLPDDLDKSEN
ncbi:MAG: hypothetical protein ACOH12_13060 [Parvibaculaceae bacterium]